MSQVKAWCGGLVLSLATAWAWAVDAPVLETAGYALCAGEANDAMAIGRMVGVFHMGKEEVVNDPNLTPYLRDMAADFFRAAEAGKVPSYVHFAQQRFATCLQKQKVPMPAGETAELVCLSRVDIPIFYVARMHAGDTPEVAAARLEEGLANRGYPPGLVRALAAPSYAIRDSEGMRALQLFVLNSCLFSPSEVGAYYGFDPSAPPPPVEAGGGKEKGGPRKP